MTSDPHRHVVINLYIWKRSLLENRFCFVSSEKKSSSAPWEPRVLGIAQGQRAEWSTSCVTWHHDITWHTLRIVCPSTSSNPACNTGFSFQLDPSSSLQQLVPSSGISEYIQTSVKYAITVCLWYELWQGLAHPLSHGWHKGFLCCWSTEFTPAYVSANTKNGRQSLSLDFSCSSILSHLP